MGNSTQQELMQKWVVKQRNITEHVVSNNGEFSVKLNGYVEIIDLKIIKNIPINALETLIMECINKGIKSVSVKAQNEFAAFKKQNNLI